MTNNSQHNLNYFRAHSLAGDPFDLNEIKSCFYKTPEIEHRLELIAHLAVFSDRIVQVFGVEGAGKSSLFHQLKPLFIDVHLIDFSVSSEETTNSLLMQIAKSLQLPNFENSNDDELFNKIINSVIKAAENGKATILMIDNVHLLSIDCLNLLFRLAINDQQQTLCHVILFTALDLQNVIQHPDLSYIHSIELTGFNKAQIKSYLQYRLEQVNHEGDFLFSEKQIAEFYKTSNGIPGIINQLAIQSLSDPALSNKQKTGKRLMLSWIFNPFWSYGISVLVVVMSISYVLLDEKNEKINSIAVNLPEKSDDIDKFEQRFEDVSIPSEVIKQSQSSEQMKSIVIEELPKDIEKPLSQLPEIKADVAQSELVNQEANQVINQQEKKPALSDEVELLSEKQDLVIPEKAITAKNDVTAIRQPVEQSIEIEKTDKGISVQTIKGADWLQNQPSRNYVLQLIGVHDPDILSQIIKDHPDLKKQLSRFATLNSGKPWYVLVYGNYNDRGEAISDIPSLPSTIRKLKPWPRTIASIHDSIKSSSQ